MRLYRYRFRGREALLALTLGPLMLPTLVTGVGLLQLFQYLGWREYIGFTALLVGHVVICMPFAVRTVVGQPADAAAERRAGGGEPRRDALGARCGTSIFPLIKTGLVAGAVFAFIHSFTDVNLSIFLARPGETPDHGEDPGLPRVRLCADARRSVGDHAAAAVDRSSPLSSG